MPDIFPRIAQGPTHTAGPDRLLLHYRDHSGQSAQLCPFSSKFQFNFFLFIPTKSFYGHSQTSTPRQRSLPPRRHRRLPSVFPHCTMPSVLFTRTFLNRLTVVFRHQTYKPTLAMVTIFCPLRADGARARTATPRTNAFEAMCVLIVLCMIHSVSKEDKIVTK